MHDLIIIGAGPGGYVAGIRASQLGLKVCIIEKDNPGGVCLNWGCIPSKNIIHQAELFLSVKELEEIGVSIDSSTLDYSKVHQKSRQATRKLKAGVEFLLKRNKIELIKGEAKIISPTKVKLNGGKEITGKNILIATGSSPLQMKGFEFDETQVLSSTGILSLKQLPKDIVILGAGAIGCEFAYVMNAFGVEVTLIEMQDQILPFEDHEVAGFLAKSFQASGIKIMTGTKALSLDKKQKKVTVTVEEKDNTQTQIETEKVLCVFGRKPNTDMIGIENIGLTTEKGFIPVGDYYQTKIKGVYAIGDVVSTPLLAHVASKEGEIAVEHIAGRKTDTGINLDLVPSAIYCNPQVASFGLREKQAKERKIKYKKFIFPYRGIGKAVAIDRAEGFLKVIYHGETSEILGAHVAGDTATELIHELLLAKSAELLPENIAETIHAHPTMSEIVMEQMKGIEGKAIHI